MPDPRDILDLTALASAHPPPPAPPTPPAPHTSDVSAARPYLRLWFECAKQYARAYRSPDGSAYVGRCPACGASTRFRVGTGGSSERFFRVSC